MLSKHFIPQRAIVVNLLKNIYVNNFDYSKITKYPTTKIPKAIRYQPNALKSLFLIYPIKNLIAITETTKATIIPVNKMVISSPVKLKPNLTSFNALAPNMTGIDKKKEYSAAMKREEPSIIAPSIVAPERDVPGIKDNTWNIPM